MFKKLLVPVDRSALAEQALGQAAGIARVAHAEVDVILVHQNVAFDGYTDAPWNAGLWKDEHKYVETIAGELTSGAGVAATHSVVSGDPAEMIIRRAHDIRADLIVMTSHGRTGLSRAWIGSVADRVIREADIPVLMLRPIEGKTRLDASRHVFKHILVPYDGTALAAAILPTASALARSIGARITLVRVVLPVPMIVPDMGTAFGYLPNVQDDRLTEQVFAEAKQQMTEAARRLQDVQTLAIDAEVVLAHSVAQGIFDIASARKVDLIAMSTHGRGPSRLVIGSVADKVIRGTGLPMLLRRPTAAVTEPPIITTENVIEQLPALAGA